MPPVDRVHAAENYITARHCQNNIWIEEAPGVRFDNRTESHSGNCTGCYFHLKLPLSRVFHSGV